MEYITKLIGLKGLGLSFTLLLFLLFYGCGSNNELIVPNLSYDPDLIESIIVSENTFQINTKTEVDMYFTYYNQDDPQERYKGFSSVRQSSASSFSVPVQSADDLYRFFFEVINEYSYKDTVFFFYGAETEDSFLRVDFVDVKQGDGALIQTPEGINIAVDGGYGTYSPGWAPNQNWNGAGYPYMLEYVQNEGISHFNYLIESHRHSDHWGGLADIIDAGIDYDYYLSATNSLGYQRGDYLNLNVPSEVEIQILNIGYPPDAINTGVNNTSIVLRIEYGDTQYLLTGDGESEVESFLLRTGFELSANLLKAGHHGSKTSSTAPFLAKVLNQFAKVVTLTFGTDNPYGHPHNQFRFKDYSVFGTGQPSTPPPAGDFHYNVGDIQTYSDGNVLIIKY